MGKKLELGSEVNGTRIIPPGLMGLPGIFGKTNK